MKEIIELLEKFNIQNILQWINHYFLFYTRPRKFWKAIEDESNDLKLTHLLFNAVISILLVLLLTVKMEYRTAFRNISIDLLFSIPLILFSLLPAHLLLKKYRYNSKPLVKELLLFILSTKLHSYFILILTLTAFVGLEEYNFLLIHNILVVLFFILIFIYSNFLFFKSVGAAILAIILNILFLNLVSLVFSSVLITTSTSRNTYSLAYMEPIQEEYIIDHDECVQIKSLPTAISYFRDNFGTGHMRKIYSYIPITDVFKYDQSTVMAGADFQHGERTDSLYQDTVIRRIKTLDSIKNKLHFKLNKKTNDLELGFYTNIKNLLQSLDTGDLNIIRYPVRVLTQLETKRKDTIVTYGVLPFSQKYFFNYYDSTSGYRKKAKFANTPLTIITFFMFYRFLVPIKEYSTCN